MTAAPGLYVALGDSMSIDLYPDLDAAEKLGTAARGLGASSLLHRNNDRIWPAFKGRDLSTLYPGIGLRNLAADGAGIGDVARFQLSEVPAAATILTLNVGGNDLLSAYGASASRRELAEEVEAIVKRYHNLVTDLRRRSREALLILTTVYDPTDGTGDLGNGWNDLPLQFLDRFNDSVRKLAGTTKNAALADVHAHFLGHGRTAKADARYYWPHSIIEPSALGASEIRRVWLHAVAAGFRT